MTDTTSAAPSEQDLFERVFPMPEGCMRCGDTYAPTEYSAWAVSAFIERFKGWQAARRAHPTPPAVVEPLEPVVTDVHGINERIHFRRGWRDTEHIEAQPLYLHPPHQPKRTVTYVCPVCAASLERQE